MIEEIEHWNLDLIWHESIPAHYDYSSTDFQRVLESLRAADPRVMIFLGDSSVILFCWLHKFKLFGPNHSIFTIEFADINGDTISIPQHVSDWCTVEMVREVMNRSFVFGEFNRADLFIDDPDQTGNTWSNFDSTIREQVADVEKAVWIYEGRKYLYYDLILFTGFVLDEAERLLNLRNDSLINWSVGSKRFKQNGQFISHIFKEAIFNVKVVGMRGTYDFDRNSTINSNGFTPISIRQTLSTNSTVNSLKIGVHHRSNVEKPMLEIFEDRIVWGTADGKAHFDMVHVIRKEVTTFPISIGFTFMGLSFITLSIFLFSYFYRKFYKIMELNFITFGIILANCQVFLLPLRNMEPVTLHCSLFAAFFMLGIGFCSTALWSLLERQLKIMRITFSNNKPIKRKPLRKFTITRIFMIISMAIMAIGIVIFINSSPFTLINHEFEMANSIGKREVILKIEQNCRMELNFLNKVTIGIIIFIISIFIIKSISICFKINQIKKKLKNIPNIVQSPRRLGTRATSFPFQQNDRLAGHEKFFSFLFSLIVSATLILLLRPLHTLMITSVSTLLLTIGGIVLILLHNQLDYQLF